ncbi:HPr kinase/phosphorylase [Methyloligella halotolerans]|uniref:HPr kinase/phosphorylase n=1 Tax=Methyloligella halotolerans TaxID=1177755 RepID=A0A1E2S0A3_9HYPH|nr:aldolase [Methyloligella halotolerans]ODA67768.1 HPr kinase/phosphorylase [Methyloligella halotolerans]
MDRSGGSNRGESNLEPLDRGELLHGTCVAFGQDAILLRGRSGAGKSDLALRCLALQDPENPPMLVADDQVRVAAGADGSVTARPPERLAGKMEVRGLGIIETPYLAQARLVVVCDLVPEEEVPRMLPEQPQTAMVAGAALPIIKLAAFHASSAMKVKLAVLAASDSRVER